MDHKCCKWPCSVSSVTADPKLLLDGYASRAFRLLTQLLGTNHELQPFSQLLGEVLPGGLESLGGARSCGGSQAGTTQPGWFWEATAVWNPEDICVFGAVSLAVTGGSCPIHHRESCTSRITGGKNQGAGGFQGDFRWKQSPKTGCFCRGTLERPWDITYLGTWDGIGIEGTWRFARQNMARPKHRGKQQL